MRRSRCCGSTAGLFCLLNEKQSVDGSANIKKMTTGTLRCHLENLKAMCREQPVVIAPVLVGFITSMTFRGHCHALFLFFGSCFSQVMPERCDQNSGSSQKTGGISLSPIRSVDIVESAYRSSRRPAAGNTPFSNGLCRAFLLHGQYACSRDVLLSFELGSE